MLISRLEAVKDCLGMPALIGDLNSILRNFSASFQEEISSSQMESQTYRFTAVRFYSLETWTLQNAETIKSYD